MDNAIKIAQTLHGYKDGHELLASSIKLPKQAALTLLERSDSPGSGFADKNNICLTGYPLDELGVYALAKTWPALEMHRPGCVWTHTLLIKYADLSRIKNLNHLTTHFKIPAVNDYELFRKTLLFSESEYDEETNASRKEIHNLLDRLYSTNNNVVLPRDQLTDKTILNVWSQQWPKLRRNFRFRTWAPHALPKNKKEFDLLLSTSEYNRLDDCNEADSYLELIDAVDDVCMPSGGKLRQFFWKYGADAGQTREAFLPLLKAWKLFEADDILYDELSKLLLQWPARPPSIVRSIASNISIDLPRTLDIDTANLLVTDLPRIRADDLSSEGEIVIGRAIATTNSASQIRSVVDNENAIKHPGILQGVLEEIPINIAIDLIEDKPSLLDPVLSYKPDILGEPEFWKHDDTALTALNFAPIDRHEKIISAMIASNNNIYSNKAVKHFGVSAIDFILETSETKRLPEAWLIAAADNPKQLLESLGSHENLPLKTLEYLAESTNPLVENPTNDNDAWISALTNQPKNSLPRKLSSFLFVRGLANIGPEQKKLIEISFDVIFDCIDKHKLNWDEWQDIERYLDFPSTWLPLSKKEKLVSGMANLSIARKYSILDIVNLSKKEKIVKLITKQVISKEDGIKLIKRTLEDDRRDIPKKMEFVFGYLDRELKKHKM